MSRLEASRLLYIPTNRNCSEAIRAYAEEAAFLEAECREPVVFALVEANDAPHVQEHARLFEDLNAKSSARLVHLTIADQSEFVDRLLRSVELDDHVRERLRELLLQQGVAYSAGPNKANLLAAALGAHTLHRRDSDTLPKEHGGVKLFASELEARFVGRKLKDVADLVENAETLPGDTVIYFIASDYQGDLPVDRMELIELSRDLLVDLESLESPGASREEVEESVTSYYLAGNQSTYEGDRVEVDQTGKTELGVSCIRAVFRVLPEMPIKDTLGCDYFQKNLLYRLDWPILYHNRKVEHRYTSDRDTRTDVEGFINYNLRDARYKILWRIWSKHNRTLEARRQELVSAPDRLIDTGVYVESFLSALAATPHDELIEIPLAMARVFERAAALAGEGAEGKYTQLVGVLLRDNSSALVKDVVIGIRDYCFLIEHWPRLIAAAEEVGFQA